VTTPISRPPASTTIAIPKRFLKKNTLKPNEKLPLKINYTFKDMTTRKHYPGKHMWRLLINGEQMKGYGFQVQR